MQQIRQLTYDLLNRSGSLEPPVLPDHLAEILNVSIDRIPLPVTARGFLKNRRIIVNYTDQPEYQNFTIARELGELMKPVGMLTVQNDTWSNDFASELLLPSHWFSKYGAHAGWDIGQLKTIFKTASWEAIARKVIWFHKCMVTILNKDGILFRKGHGPLLSELQHIETYVLEKLAECNSHQLIHNNRMYRGWRIDNHPEGSICILMSENLS